MLAGVGKLTGLTQVHGGDSRLRVSELFLNCSPVNGGWLPPPLTRETFAAFPAREN